MKDKLNMEIYGFSKVASWLAVVGTPIMLMMVYNGTAGWIQYIGILGNVFIMWNNWEYIKKSTKNFLFP